jgi:hypothetical protein
MKKLLLLLTVLAFLVTGCNNKKASNTPSLNNREKDDYGKNDNLNNRNENKTNVNTGSTGWAENDRTRFLKECVGSFDENNTALANQICPCVLGKMEKEYTSYSEADTKGGEEAGKRLALQCKDEITGTESHTTTTSNWTKNDEDQWMNACSTPLVAKMGEQRTASYCSCILEKLKTMYSSYEDMNTKASSETGAQLGKECIKELGIGQ